MGPAGQSFLPRMALACGGQTGLAPYTPARGSQAVGQSPAVGFRVEPNTGSSRMWQKQRPFKDSYFKARILTLFYALDHLMRPRDPFSRKMFFKCIKYNTQDYKDNRFC